MKHKAWKIIFLVLFIVSLILNIVLVTKEIFEGSKLCFSDEIKAHNDALDILLEGKHDSQSLANRLYYIWQNNNNYCIENKDRIIYVVFEGKELKIISYDQLQVLQNQVKSYKGNYLVEVYADEETGIDNKVILTKI